MWNTSGVLVGLAEVKIPFRRLPQEDHNKVMHGIYKVLTGSPDDDDEEKELGRKAIGVIDEYFAMQEVVLEENVPGEFVIRRDRELILKFRCMDVLFSGLVRDNDARVILGTRSTNFGRTAVLLQFKNREDASGVIEKIKQGLNKRPSLHGKGHETAAQEPTIMSKLTSFITSPKKENAPTHSGDSKQPDYIPGDDSSDESDSEEEQSNEEPENLPVKQEPTPPAATTKKAPDPQAMIEAEMNYILETEHKYVENLTSLENDRENLADTAPPYIRKWLCQLFRQVKSLATTHENLLQALSDAKYNIKKFSDAFVLHNKQFRFYVYFIENIPTVDKIIAEFSPYFKEKIPNLIEKLRQPRLRLNHYVLMLESLQKKVENEDKCSLQRAIDMCKKYLKEADQALFLCSIKGCPFQGSQCGKLIHQSELKLSASPDLPNTKYSVILMEKKLIIALGKLDDFQFVHSIPLEEIILREQYRGLYFSFFASNEDLGTGNKRYVFKAGNVRRQQEWLEKLNSAINAMKTNLERSNTRASFGRSARKLRRKLTTPRSMLKESSSEVEKNSDSDSESSKNYWMNRRKNFKKYSSHREQKSMTIYVSGSFSDGEASPWVSHGMAPLTVWNCFPRLESLYRLLGNQKLDKDPRVQWIFKERNEGFLMNAIEEQYVNDLQRQLGTFLNEDIVLPPKQIQKDIRRLYPLHKNELIPIIDQYDDIEKGFLEALTQCGENIAAHYSEFLIDRCTFHEEMMSQDLSENYTGPLKHFEKYCIAVILIRHEKKIHEELTNTAATILHDTITNTNNYLMAECINNAPFALSQCDPILLVSKLKVKIDTRSKNECEVVLVKDRLFILEMRPPLYDYLCSLQMDCVSLGPGSDKCQFQLVYGTSAAARKVYTFRALREDIIKRWEEEIRTILTEQARKLKQAVIRRTEEAPSLTVGADSLAVNHTVNIVRSPGIKPKNTARETQSSAQTETLAAPTATLSRSPAIKKKSLTKEPDQTDSLTSNARWNIPKSPQMNTKSLPKRTEKSKVVEKFI